MLIVDVIIVHVFASYYQCVYKTASICFSVLFSLISSGYRIVTMIPPADYVEKTFQMMDAANVYDYSAMVRTDFVT